MFYTMNITVVKYFGTKIHNIEDIDGQLHIDLDKIKTFACQKSDLKSSKRPFHSY